MDQLLAKWEAQSARLKTLDVRIYRIDKNAEWGEEIHYEGRAVFKSPQLAYLDFKKLETRPKRPGEVGPGADPKDPEASHDTPGDDHLRRE